MERSDLNPMRVDGSHKGKMVRCVHCNRTAQYETGYTFAGVTEDTDGSAHITYFWFCHLTCLLSRVQGARA